VSTSMLGNAGREPCTGVRGMMSRGTESIANEWVRRRRGMMSGDRRDMVDKFTENTGTQVRWWVGTGGWELRMGKLGWRRVERDPSSATSSIRRVSTHVTAQPARKNVNQSNSQCRSQRYLANFTWLPPRVGWTASGGDMGPRSRYEAVTSRMQRGTRGWTRVRSPRQAFRPRSMW
jgi:hypothetical protein